MSSNVIGQLGQQLRTLTSKMRHVFHRARVTAPAQEAGDTQVVQVTNFQGESARDVRSYQNYGFASSPPVGCEMLIVNANGDSGAGYAIASNDPRVRPTGMTPGEVRLYVGPDRYVQLKPGSAMALVDPVGINLQTPVVNCTKLVASDDVLTGTVSLRNHVHQNTMPQSGSFSGTPKP